MVRILNSLTKCRIKLLINLTVIREINHFLSDKILKFLYNFLKTKRIKLNCFLGATKEVNLILLIKMWPWKILRCKIKALMYLNKTKTSLKNTKLLSKTIIKKVNNNLNKIKRILLIIFKTALPCMKYLPHPTFITLKNKSTSKKTTLVQSQNPKISNNTNSQKLLEISQWKTLTLQ